MRRQKIQERDIEVLVSLHEYRYLSTSQIKSLHFPSAQTARRRLSAMEKLSLIKRFDVPNIADDLFHLTSEGARYVAFKLEQSPEAIKIPRKGSNPRDYYFMHHFMSISDFRIALTKACERHPLISLTGYIPEHIGAITKSGYLRKHITDQVNDPLDGKILRHTPDAVFVLSKQGKTALFFVEIDRGKELLSNPQTGIRKMLRFYVQYAREQKYNRYANAFSTGSFTGFRLLIVTTSQRRLQNMRARSTSNALLTPKFKRYIWLTTFEQLSTESIMSGIWLNLDAIDSAFYSIG